MFGLLATGCAQVATDQGGARGPLAGTQWRLERFQSMDDAQAPLISSDPSRYTLAFSADGRAEIRLDCNRGSASWSSSGEADAGSLRFGPIASTRMLCPPDSFGTRLAQYLTDVRGYRLVGGRLTLSLMADAGLLTWEPSDEPMGRPR